MRGDGIRASAAIVPICQSGGTRAGIAAAAAAAVLQMMPVLMSVLALAFIGGAIARGTLDIWTVSPLPQENMLLLRIYLFISSETIMTIKLRQQTLLRSRQPFNPAKPLGNFK